jgi:hypothetical protein
MRQPHLAARVDGKLLSDALAPGEQSAAWLGALDDLVDDDAVAVDHIHV